jgi:hypothetical protein
VRERNCSEIETFRKGGYTTNGLLAKEATEQVQRELRQLVGRKIRWTVQIGTIHPTYEEIYGGGKFNGCGKYYLSMWTIPSLPTAADYRVDNDMTRPCITLSDIGRDKFVTLDHTTQVIVEGTIQEAEISYGAETIYGFYLDSMPKGIRLIICSCKASLLER